jgi:hypothetical protein
MRKLTLTFGAMAVAACLVTTLRPGTTTMAQGPGEPAFPPPIGIIQGVPADASLPSPIDPATEDPMAAVEEFLQRSRREADEKIKALTQEAETLHVRLTKVEAALGRWKAVADSLGQGQLGREVRGAVEPPPLHAIDSVPPSLIEQLEPVTPPDTTPTKRDER